MQKVLIISPTPTHPTNAGNRAHITELSKLLQKKGFDVFFLYFAYEDFDREKMTSFWGDHLFIIEKVRLFEKGPLVSYYFKRLLQEAKKIKRYLQYTTGSINKSQLRFNGEIDNYFPRSVKNEIRALQNEHHFDIVFCEYVSFSRVLTFFEKKVFKILDTHDRFTDRFSMYLKNGLQPEWLSLYSDQEKKALSRASLVIALQEDEKLFFQGLSDTPVIRFFCIPEAERLPGKRFEKKLMYFSSSNNVNHKTLHVFENEILPLVMKKHPDVQLLVGGSICNTYVPSNCQTKLLGEYDNPADFYATGDIVINPELHGTGFKIKTLEAMCFSLPIVCTRAGAAGLVEPFYGQFLLAESNDFANRLIQLIENEGLRENIVSKATLWVNEMKVAFHNKLFDQIHENYHK